MKKFARIALILAGLALAVVVGRPVLFLANVWWHDEPAPRSMPAAGTGDASRLYENQPSEVIDLALDPEKAE
ncbi:MAG TPA: hypothetical protein VEA63_11710, partial [Opitutus sp.]|nr:hypothetical protein [Opitutus sp.]